MNFFATAAKGTEPALRDELRELRLRGVRADRGGVHFAGELREAFRACLWSRVAMRVLLELGEFEARDGAALYAGVRAIDWLPWLTPRMTLAVSATCRSSALTHTQFIAQKTKDAIVDQLRDRLGARPSVDLEDPDLRIVVHIARDQARIYLDLAGEPLHRRGYRVDMSEAPLKETLAAAMLRLGGWDRTRPLVDPMCGSGTIAIEAALWSRNVAPGLSRRFGFERWASFGEAEARVLVDLREQARAAQKRHGPPVLASDASESAVAAARANARAAGADLLVVRRDMRELRPTEPPGFVVTNPPYGERIAGSAVLYRDMAAAFTRLRGHRVLILAGTPEIERAIRRRPQRSLVLFNGPIECRLLAYEMV